MSSSLIVSFKELSFFFSSHPSAPALVIKTPAGFFFLSPRSRKIIRSMSQLFSAGVQILSARPFTATD